MRILVVEDERLLCDGIAEDLRLEKYTVDCCYDGPAACERLFVEPYDLVVLDLNLPGMDGLELLRHIRTEQPELRVLILSARSQLSDKVAGLDLGADDYLTKPFEFEELAARIRALLRRRSPEKTDAVSVGDLTVEFSTRRVIRGGKEINLSSKEFALLESLIRHKGAVLSRTQLENQVWDYGFEGGSNIVDVYIRYLRKKLDDPFEKKLIHTIRGAGYTLREE